MNFLVNTDLLILSNGREYQVSKIINLNERDKIIFGLLSRDIYETLSFARDLSQLFTEYNHLVYSPRHLIPFQSFGELNERYAKAQPVIESATRLIIRFDEAINHANEFLVRVLKPRWTDYKELAQFADALVWYLETAHEIRERLRRDNPCLISPPGSPEK